jgi:hypothetical protein
MRRGAELKQQTGFRRPKRSLKWCPIYPDPLSSATGIELYLLAAHSAAGPCRTHHYFRRKVGNFEPLTNWNIPEAKGSFARPDVCKIRALVLLWENVPPTLAGGTP